MANTLDNTLNKVGTTLETIFGSKNKGYVKNPQINDEGQTVLERVGIEARREHLFRNEWKKDLQYTRALVNSEYEIQTEFIVSSYQDDLIGVNKQNEIDNLNKIKNNAERKLEMMERNTKPKETLKKQ